MLYLFTFITAIIHSIEELEIEGKTKHGWARGLPTKRFYNWFTQLTVGKELTLYHICMLIRLFALYHLIFTIIPWSLKLEYIILGNISFYFVIEDFFWFVLNPKFRIKRFKQKYISWHKHWILGLPDTYWYGIVMGILFIFFGGYCG